MLRIIWITVRALLSAFRSRRDLALRQQFAAFKARDTKARIRYADHAFWVVLRRRWSCWADVPAGTVAVAIRAAPQHMTSLLHGFMAGR